MVLTGLAKKFQNKVRLAKSRESSAAREIAGSLCGGAFDDEDDTETDHIDEAKKECRAAVFSNYCWYAAHGGVARLERDLVDNAQLVHTKCHREKTRAALKRKRDPDEIAAFTAGAARRTCTNCKREQEADQFVSHKSRHPTWVKCCQTCRDIYTTSRNNPSTVHGSVRKRYRDEKTRLDREGVCCCGCGRPLRNRAFDFDHDMAVRDATHPRLSEAHKFRSVEAWEQERLLCRPVLKSCHKRITHTV